MVLGEVNDLGVSWWRLDGYKKALGENNIDIDDELIISGEYNSGTAYENVNKLLKKEKI